MATQHLDQTDERLLVAIRNFLNNIPPGTTVETIEVARAMLAQTRSELRVKEIQEMVRRESDALGVDWRDASSPIFAD